MRALGLFLAALVVIGLASCSFTTAGKFEECKTDFDCGAATACTEGYCLTLPAGCRREEAGGTTRAFEQPARIPLVALLPIKASSGMPDDSETQSANAIKLAISEANDRLNATRGFFGLFVCDTDATIDGGGLELQATWFIENLKVPALIVSSSGPTQKVAQLGARLDAGTLVISPNATSPELTISFTQTGNVWRIPPTDVNQARVVVDLVARDFPDAGVLIDVLHAKGTYGAGFANPLAEQLIARGFRATLRPFDPNDAETQNKAVTDVSNDGPAGTVLIGNTTVMVPIIEKAKTFGNLKRGSGHRWYLTDSMKEQTLLTPSTLLELDLSQGTAPAQGAGTAYPTFRDGFRTRYGTDPESTNYTSHSYDATWLVMLAAQFAEGAATPDRTRVTGAKLGEGLVKLSLSTGPAIPLRADKWAELSDALARGTPTNVEGASGHLDFDLDAGAPSAPYEVWQVRDGGIHVVRTVP